MSSSINIIGPFTNSLEFKDDFYKKIVKSNNETLLKELNIKTGVNVETMVVEIYYRGNNDTGNNTDAPEVTEKVVINSENQNSTSIHYNLIYKIVVKDTDENSVVNQLSNDTATKEDNTDNILSKEEYQNLENSAYKWKKNYSHEINESMKNKISLLQKHVGEKVEIIKSGEIGYLRFVGVLKETGNLEKHFCGIEFDKPIGKNNGCFANDIDHLYFGPVAENHGIFVPVTAVRVVVDTSKSAGDEEAIEEL